MPHGAVRRAIFQPGYPACLPNNLLAIFHTPVVMAGLAG
jgi:hypothetical protein